jgi:hypothetical protein
VTDDRRRRAAAWLAGLAALALAGCGGSMSDVSKFGSTDAWKAEPNKFPADYKQDLLNHLRTELIDPTNIRAAFITEPALKPSGNESRYVVCLRYNARNSEGRYEGSKDTLVLFYGGQINQMLEAGEQCKNAPYQPFPELERLKRLDAR